MSDESKNETAGKELRIEDLPSRAIKAEEEDATKGGYSGGLSGVGIFNETEIKLTAIYDDGSVLVDGT